jgi:hypothetical protein
LTTVEWVLAPFRMPWSLFENQGWSLLKNTSK